MAKTIFLIPGFKTQISDAMYQWLIRYLKSNGYVVYPVPVTWNNRTITQNAKDFLDFFEARKTKNNYIVGFSYGAVIALMTPKQTQPRKLLLCSLSPDFQEDSGEMPNWLKKYIGKKRYADILTRSGRELAKLLQANTVLFCGEKESLNYPQLQKRSAETAKLAVNAKLIMVQNAPHDISFPAYQDAVQKEL